MNDTFVDSVGVQASIEGFDRLKLKLSDGPRRQTYRGISTIHGLQHLTREGLRQYYYESEQLILQEG